MGTARVDLLVDSKTDTVYFNEINPLIELAIERHAAHQELDHSFSSNFLRQF